MNTETETPSTPMLTTTVDTSHWRRIVLKIGSALIAPDRNGCKTRHLLSIAQFIEQCRAQDIQVTLVSSGAVAAGAYAFKNTENPSIAAKKAMAAKGQMDMIATWDKLLDSPVAQLLITQFDLQDHDRYKSIQATAFELLDNGIIPILNENDAVCTNDHKIGDNDNLAAMIAAAVDADALIICTDVTGLYNKNPNEHEDAHLIRSVEHINSQIYDMAGGVSSSVGTGGMKTKLEAAEKATSNGIETYLIDGGKHDNFLQLLQGKNPGTRFSPHKNPLESHEHWLRHTSKEQGEMIVQDSVENRLDGDHLPIGCDDLINVVGSFNEGDTVLVRTEAGKKLAKATSQYSSSLLNLVTQDDIDHDVIYNDEGNQSVITGGAHAVFEEKKDDNY